MIMYNMWQINESESESESGKLSTLLKGLRRIGTKFKLQLGHSDLILKNW